MAGSWMDTNCNLPSTKQNDKSSGCWINYWTGPKQFRAYLLLRSHHHHFPFLNLKMLGSSFLNDRIRELAKESNRRNSYPNSSLNSLIGKESSWQTQWVSVRSRRSNGPKAGSQKTIAVTRKMETHFGTKVPEHVQVRCLQSESQKVGRVLLLTLLKRSERCQAHPRQTEDSLFLIFPLK